MKTRYVVKGIGKEQTIDSKVLIYFDKVTGKITKVEDKWDGKLPDSSFQNVSIEQLFSPWWWFHYGEGWVWYTWSLTWDTRWWQVRLTIHQPPPCNPLNFRFFHYSKSLRWLIKILQAFRKINAVTVPHLVGVPKNDEEDAKKGL